MYLLNGEGVVKEEVEYELIPVSPVRKLEGRLDRLEKSPAFDSGSFFREVLEIVRMNQQIVDELAKSNDALRIELSKLPGRLDDLITNTKELLSYIKVAGEQETTGLGPEVMKPVVEKLDELVKENKKISEKNNSMLELLDEVGKKLRRPPVKHRPPMPQQRPLPVRM